jgi:hypothetical protein
MGSYPDNKGKVTRSRRRRQENFKSVLSGYPKGRRIGRFREAPPLFGFLEFEPGGQTSPCYCFRPAGCRLFPFPGVFACKNPRPKSGTEAAALGRQDVACNHCLEFARSANRKAKKRHGCRFFARARDRRGAEQPRREAAGPEAKPEPWQPPVALIARFFAASPQKMRQRTGKK